MPRPSARVESPGSPRRRAAAAAMALALLASGGAAQETAPEIVHQPALCTIPDTPISVCAVVSDDGRVVKVRAFFRPEGERHFSFVELEPRGDEYCGALPAPREGKMDRLEYYLWAVDDEYVPQRTSPFFLELQEEGVCGFPPLELDPERAGSITVYATSARQGDELDDDFVRSGVTFVPRKR